VKFEPYPTLHKKPRNIQSNAFKQHSNIVSKTAVHKPPATTAIKQRYHRYQVKHVTSTNRSVAVVRSVSIHATPVSSYSASSSFSSFPSALHGLDSSVLRPWIRGLNSHAFD
jgi:hypothetical protein